MSRVTKAVLAAEVLGAYVRARHAVRRKGLPGALARARASGGAAPVRDRAGAGPAAQPAADARSAALPAPDPRQLARATTRTLEALGAVPGVDGRCLMQSLVLITLLARRGWAGELVIAVRPGEAFGAHAWVELDGRPLLPAEAPGFGRLVTL